MQWERRERGGEEKTKSKKSTPETPGTTGTGLGRPFCCCSSSGAAGKASGGQPPPLDWGRTSHELWEVKPSTWLRELSPNPPQAGLKSTSSGQRGNALTAKPSAAFLGYSSETGKGEAEIEGQPSPSAPCASSGRVWARKVPSLWLHGNCNATEQAI